MTRAVLGMSLGLGASSHPVFCRTQVSRVPADRDVKPSGRGPKTRRPQDQTSHFPLRLCNVLLMGSEVTHFSVTSAKARQRAMYQVPVVAQPQSCSCPGPAAGFSWWFFPLKACFKRTGPQTVTGNLNTNKHIIKHIRLPSSTFCPDAEDS